MHANDMLINLIDTRLIPRHMLQYIREIIIEQAVVNDPHNGFLKSNCLPIIIGMQQVNYYVRVMNCR